VRADRLLSLLLLLESGRRKRVCDLAARLEVSARTLYRDLDALSAAGVPVYAQRGRGGGVALLEGWRTRLDGLTAAEAEALGTIGIPRALGDLGLSRPLRQGLVKLAATLPQVQRLALERSRQRLHIDSTAWFGSPEQAPHLALLRDAAWQDRRVWLRYRDFDGRASRRNVAPLGLVIKLDRWYLVAHSEQRTLVLRGSRIEAAEATETPFQRPTDFDLAAYWREWCRRFARQRASYPVRLRLSARGADLLARQRPAGDVAEGTTTIDFERRTIALAQVMLLGREAEVLAPEELRDALRELGRDLRALYDGP